jgi:hypothetical protein
MKHALVVTQNMVGAGQSELEINRKGKGGLAQTQTKEDNANA